VVVRVGRATDVGPPPTAVIGEPLPDGVPLAAIEVSDTGPGMNPGDAARVFERLYRAETEHDHAHEHEIDRPASAEAVEPVAAPITRRS